MSRIDPRGALKARREAAERQERALAEIECRRELRPAEQEPRRVREADGQPPERSR